MSDYAPIAQTIMESLGLRVAPVAVCMTDEPPEGIPSPSKPVAAGCVFWQQGAEATFVTSPTDHQNCT